MNSRTCLKKPFKKKRKKDIMKVWNREGRLWKQERDIKKRKTLKRELGKFYRCFFL
jgi:hypothetical protein